MVSVACIDTVSSPGRTEIDVDDRNSLILSDIEEYDSFNTYVADFNSQLNHYLLCFSESMSSDPGDDQPPDGSPPGRSVLNLDTLITDDQHMAVQSPGVDHISGG